MREATKQIDVTFYNLPFSANLNLYQNRNLNIFFMGKNPIRNLDPKCQNIWAEYYLYACVVI